MDLISKAESVFLANFPPETCFERAIFFSWACQIEKCCTYCYMSTLPKEMRTNERVRSFGSLLAETVLCKVCGWDYGFLSGGVGVFNNEKILDLVKKSVEIMGEKIWINIGNITKEDLLLYKPYIKGIIGTVEVVNEEVHKKVCPSKPISGVEKMFSFADEIGVDKGMTIIVGLGETIEDFPFLEKFIRKHNVKKIHMYGLNPQKGTIFENKESPSAKYQAEWIAKTRIAFPKIDIQCGIWRDKVDRVGLLLKAGANSISKFPILKDFGKIDAIEIEKQAKLSGREFKGTVSKLPKTNWEKIINDLSFKNALKEDIFKKLKVYLKRIEKNERNLLKEN